MCFTFTFMIHFELIRVKGMWSVSRLTSLRVDVQFFQHHLLKDYPCSPVLPLLLCQQSVDYICACLFLGSLLCSIDLSVLLPTPHRLDYCSFIVSLFLKINLFIIFKIYLFLAVLGLRCCARAFSSCGERGLLFVAVRGLLIAVASLIAEHGL